MNFSFGRGVALVSAAICIAVSTSSVRAAATTEPYPFAPPWVADQTVYEVNLRQFSATGDVEGLRAQLPRLKALGVGTLWIMPVYPIGVQGRTGKLGSPYAVADFVKFNPELGTIDQFKTLVDEAHRMGLYVILDWVANHSSLDNVWLTDHPDWYKRNDAVELVHPMPEWKDVIAFDFSNAALRHAMIDAMSYWVRDMGVDGFRCDSAEFTPLDFWCEARDALRAIKPIFMLAEGNDPKLMNYAFDAAYAWNLPSNTEGIVKGNKTPADLCNYIAAEQRVLPPDGFRLNFTTNQDKNAWEGTTKEQLGEAAPACTVLTFTLPGLPLIYNGQEAGLNAEHRLNFFDRDPISWQDDPAADLYRKLASLKRNHPALWASPSPARVEPIAASTSNTTITFMRNTPADRVVVMLNLSAQPAPFSTPSAAANLDLVLSDGSNDQPASGQLKPWGFRVWGGATKTLPSTAP